MYALAHYNLGYCYFKQKQYGEAQNRFRQYIDLESNQNAPALADAYNRVGDCLYQNRQFAQAEENYSRAAATATFRRRLFSLPERLPAGLAERL